MEAGKVYPAVEALNLVRQNATAKFDESVDVAIQLGIDPRKSDQAVRGAVVMPEGTGKTVRVAVFTQGAKADEARAAGADIVGFDDLAHKVKAGELDFDVVIASPDAMRVVGQLGQILGPRGLMPNPKVGTVTPNVAQAVKNAKLVRFSSAPTRPVSFMPRLAVLLSKPSVCRRILQRSSISSTSSSPLPPRVSTSARSLSLRRWVRASVLMPAASTPNVFFPGAASPAVRDPVFVKALDREPRKRMPGRRCLP